LVIASKLDKDIESKTCRLCFHGQVVKLLPVVAADKVKYLESIQIIKEKQRFGKVDKVVDNRNIHVRDLFKKETALDVFFNLKVKLVSSGQEGVIMGTFGKSGKLKVMFSDPMPNWNDPALVGSDVVLTYKKSMTKK
jgi:selenocysteine-specific elongation factor